jgi:uncharacterized protein YbjT (DUF2867 family)
MRALVTGITGYVGAALAPSLRAAGHEVRGFARDLSRVRVADVPVVRGDALTGEGLDEAMDGIDVAYHLIHSMEPGAAGDEFPARERRAAENVAGAARAAGVRRIVYLGGLVPPGERISPHLGSRLAVEEILLREVPDSVALRASIVIGARSRSFRFLVHLIERLPVLALPAWHPNRTAPIDGRDVIVSLLRAAEEPRAAGRSLDIAGPEVLSYGEMIERIADLMLVGRPAVRFRGVSATAVAAPVAAAVAGEDVSLIAPLMAGLESDLLPRNDDAREILGVRLHSFDAAVERAMRDWEAEEPLRGR